MSAFVPRFGTVKAEWRVGRPDPINVYEGDRPVCQCLTAEDAQLIVDSVNLTHFVLQSEWPRCPVCRGFGRIDDWYCACQTGRDLERVESHG